jgi:hypothetical protein
MRDKNNAVLCGLCTSYFVLRTLCHYAMPMRDARCPFPSDVDVRIAA